MPNLPATRPFLGYSPFDGSIDVVDNVSIVFGDVVLNVDNDKCLGAHCLLNHKTARVEITVEAAVGGSEFEDAVVRVGDAAGIVLRVTLAPNHFLRGGIRQYLHSASEHHALKSLGIAKIDACLRVCFV